MEIINLIPEALLTLIVGTSVLGVFLKQIPMIKDCYIPLILMCFTISFSIAILGLSADSILQGILTWGVAVGAHQTVHQMLKK